MPGMVSDSETAMNGEMQDLTMRYKPNRYERKEVRKSGLLSSVDL